jgi:hypothetical protein
MLGAASGEPIRLSGGSKQCVVLPAAAVAENRVLANSVGNVPMY